MKVRIVSRGESNNWILGKIAIKLRDELIKAGVETDIGESSDPRADINHHMLYLDYNTDLVTPGDTIMITHVDNSEKLARIKMLTGLVQLGICMSAQTMQMLQDTGVESSKLCYINPSHDGVIQPKKIVIGITTAIYADGRKREQFLIKILDKIDPTAFIFKIMGAGWENIVSTLHTKGVEIEYWNQFNYDRYTTLIPELDYYLYLGQDEGSMGFVDALAAGVKTIVTPQGYHLDAPGGITYSFNTVSELASIFNRISTERAKRIDSVKTWTWPHYALKHLEVWNYILNKEAVQSPYQDGLNSLLNKTNDSATYGKMLKAKYRLLYLTFNRFIHSKDKIGKIKRKFKE